MSTPSLAHPTRRAAEHESTPMTPETEPGSGVREALRGVSYDDAVQRLAPAGGASAASSTQDGAAGETDQEAARAEAERVERAEADWVELFGQAIGSGLFGLVREHLSAQDLNSYANEAVGALVDQASAVSGLLNDGESARAAETFINALEPKLAELVEGWLASETGQRVFRAISQWVEEHPAAVTAAVGGAAIAAAAAAWLTNMDPPAFEQTFQLGDFAVGGSLDLAALEALAVDAASVTARYQTAGIDVSLTGTYDREGGLGVSGEASAEGDIGSVSLDGSARASFSEAEGLSLGVDGGASALIGDHELAARLGLAHAGTTTVTGSLSLEGGGFDTSLTGSYSPSDDRWSLRVEGAHELASFYTQLSERDGTLDITDGATATHGRSQIGVEHTRSGGEHGGAITGSSRDIAGSGVSLDGRVGFGARAGEVRAGVDYTNEWLSSQLTLAMGESNTLSHATTVERGNFEATAGFTVDLDQGLLDRTYATFGFRDPEQFRGFLVEYAAEWVAENDAYSHSVSVMLEHAIGTVNGRLEADLTAGPGGVSSGGIHALAGIPLTDDLQLLTGAGYEGGPEGAGLDLGLGVQLGDVGIMGVWTPGVGGATDEGSIGLRLTVPLGRR